MPSTFSIENINLNGHILTADGGSLYINNEQVKNTSGIQLTERFFIKGYAPVSFYSRWSTVGTYLDETYFNDKFMATGILISCAIPATGEQTLYGRFYSRKPTSVTETQTIGYFNLPTRSTYISIPLNYQIQPNNIIGLDIYGAPNELKNISLNLLGYSPAASHFDKMPASISFYEKEQINQGENIKEQYNQHEAEYTGIKILAKTSGYKSTLFENITGYVSGYLSNNPKYDLVIEPNSSGYIANGTKYFFATGTGFNQFNNIPNFFSPTSGYSWSGFQLSEDADYFYSSYDNEKYGFGEIFEPIGTRSVPVQELITGFISGYKASGQPVIQLNEISGFAGDERIGNLPLTSGSSGYLIGGSGFYFGTGKYFFKTGLQFSGFAQFSEIFTQQLGYQYYPIASNPDYLYTNFFSGIIPDSSGGHTGELIGYIGYRYITGNETVSGFAKVKSNYNFEAIQSNDQNISGLSGYYIENKNIKFKNQNLFSGFDNQSGFDENYGYEYQGFDPDKLFDFTGIGEIVILQKPITGFVSGELKITNEFEIFTGTNASSGYIIDGNRYYFTGEFSGIRSGMSGFTDDLGFEYIVNNQTFQFDNSNFIIDNPENFYGSGIITGNIGYKNITGIDFSFGTGVIKSIIGYRNYNSTLPLLGKFYYKNDSNEKIYGPTFTLETGSIYNKTNLTFSVPSDVFVGFDILKTLDQVSGLNVALFGYYN